jgi:hypothetical protein
VEKTAASGIALKEIIQMSEKVGDMISQIATAATQQSSATEQVNSNVSQISSLTQGSSLAAEQTAKACSELSTMALDLQNLVSQFKLGGTRSNGSPRFERAGTSPAEPHSKIRRVVPSTKSKAAAGR